MPATIGGAGIGTGVALHFSRGSGAISTVVRIAVVFEGLLRIGRLILRTRFGRQGLLRRNLITVFFTVNNPREKFSHPPRPGSPSRACRCAFASAGKHCIAQRRRHRLRMTGEEKTLEIGTLLHAQGADGTLHGDVLLQGDALADASTTAPQQGRKFFTSGCAATGVETRICAKLRTPFARAQHRLMPWRWCAANRSA
ncbi:hypothetical protein [Stenotrophomonas sp. C1657]|uniref:hypothetical protein n=1 Tax=Stenotrophomonas sp. C1657 TaxID=3077844 RepID=UPI00293C1DAE|nr:hypothetical protein [Stenotrophomonas sp. C1657]MDV3516433.1 hypothetical protein [Stenotrophomonas sp. C1657]